MTTMLANIDLASMGILSLNFLEVEAKLIPEML